MTDTLNLFLIRHAKSSWNDPFASDHDRPLNNRGRKAAGTIGKWLAAKGHIPDQVLCSTAARAVETWAGIEEKLGVCGGTITSRRLYLADPVVLMDAIRQAQGRTLFLIGHNPGIAMFAEILTRAFPADPNFHRYPTCATTHFRFDTDEWSGVGEGQGEIVDFITPQQLSG